MTGQENFHEAVWAATDLTDADKAHWLYTTADGYLRNWRWWESKCRGQAAKNVELSIRVEALARALTDLIAVVDSDDIEAGTDLVALEAALETAKARLAMATAPENRP